MKVLVIGSGGREHAICYTFAKSERVSRVYCANGNAGIAAVAECIDIKPDEIRRLADFAAKNEIGLTFVGGETPLALGIADEFESRGLRIIGASRDAARLESSKAFAKDFMRRHSIPTAEYHNANSAAEALRILGSGAFGNENTPVVVKADGLAAGKGVVIARDREAAIDAVNQLAELVGPDAAEKIVLEEFLEGSEVSLIMFADGEDFALMPPTRDHKRIGEGDTGPNTGGMGTATDSAFLSEKQMAEIAATIIRPTLSGCIAEGFRFRGILFLGLMMTAAGPKLLEYNVRFGDPETQSILVRLKTDLSEICEAMLGGTLASTPIRWEPGNSACVILASEGYPKKAKTGDLITGIEPASKIPDVTVFHGATAWNPEGGLVTSGGRVLGVTAVGDTLESALAKVYSAVGKISWNGMQFRRDIGRTDYGKRTGGTS